MEAVGDFLSESVVQGRTLKLSVRDFANTVYFPRLSDTPPAVPPSPRIGRSVR
jgi:hypothetical protein